MLTGMCYRDFRIAHIYGHHRYAGTARDSATARLSEGFYSFFLRAVPGQLAEAWRNEQTRVAKRWFKLFVNPVSRDAALMGTIFAVVAVMFGWRGVAFFASESTVGIVVLELFNYIAHYGLVQATRARRAGAVRR